jgi:hypothetical protein
MERRCPDCRVELVRVKLMVAGNAVENPLQQIPAGSTRDFWTGGWPGAAVVEPWKCPKCGLLRLYSQPGHGNLPLPAASEQTSEDLPLPAADPQSSSPLSEFVRAEITDRFGVADVARVAELLERADIPLLPEPGRWRDRIYLGIVKVAGGDLRRLQEAVRVAETDWRDLLVAAGLEHTNWPEVLRKAGFRVPG